MKGKQLTGLPSRHPLIQLPQHCGTLGLFHSPYLWSHCSLHLEHWSHCLKGCPPRGLSLTFSETSQPALGSSAPALSLRRWPGRAGRAPRSLVLTGHMAGRCHT